MTVPLSQARNITAQAGVGEQSAFPSLFLLIGLPATDYGLATRVFSLRSAFEAMRFSDPVNLL